MKRMLFVMIALSAISVVLFAQAVQGSKGQWYNRATVMYSDTSFHAATTTAYTAMIPFYPSQAIRVFARTNDSLYAEIAYCLRNSKLNFTTPYVILDSVVTLYALDAATADTTIAMGHPLANLAGADSICLNPKALTGFDQIRFRIDYISGTSTDSNGSAVGSEWKTKYFRLYYYFVKP